jgi:hypothetical protein
VNAVSPSLLLSESSDGWLLTVTLSRAAIDQLATAVQPGRIKLRPGQVSISISPNLVPCEQFDLSAVHIIVTDAPTADRGAGASVVDLERHRD